MSKNVPFPLVKCIRHYVWNGQRSFWSSFDMNRSTVDPLTFRPQTCSLVYSCPGHVSTRFEVSTAFEWILGTDGRENECENVRESVLYQSKVLTGEHWGRPIRNMATHRTPTTAIFRFFPLSIGNSSTTAVTTVSTMANWLSAPSVNNMTKNRIDQRGATGIIAIPSGYATNASPGPAYTTSNSTTITCDFPKSVSEMWRNNA